MSNSWLPAEHGTDNRALNTRVTRGLTWTLVEQWGRLAVNLLLFIVIARLVEPSDVGLVALAAVFVSFAQLFADQGLADALIQRRGLTRSHIDTAFWISFSTGVVLALAGALGAPFIAAFFGQPELGPILQVLSASIVLYALSSTQMALLRRELAFRALALRALLAMAGGGAIGIALAYLGYGAWALVAQHVSTGALSVAVLWRVSPWRPSFNLSAARFRELFSFGIHVVGSELLTLASRRTDNLLIGYFLGPVALGVYTVAYRILEAGGALLIGIARRMAFPAFARLQSDPERMRRAYGRVNRISGAVIMPGFLFLALTAPEVITVLFGSQWTDAGPVAAILFLIGIVYAVAAFSSAMLNAAGRPDIVLRFRLVTTVVNVIGFLVAVQFGVLAVAAAYVARGYLLLPLNLYWLRRYAGVPMRDFVDQLKGVTVATAAMGVTVLALKTVVGGGLPLVALLLVEAAVAGLTFGLVLWLVERDVVREMMALGLDVLPSRRRLRRMSRVEDGRADDSNGPSRQPPAASPDEPLGDVRSSDDRLATGPRLEEL